MRVKQKKNLKCKRFRLKVEWWMQEDLVMYKPDYFVAVPLVFDLLYK